MSIVFKVKFRNWILQLIKRRKWKRLRAKTILGLKDKLKVMLNIDLNIQKNS
jgi:hypothetical protein